MSKITSKVVGNTLEVIDEKGNKRVIQLKPPFDPSTLPKVKFSKSVTRELLISLVTDVREQGYSH